MPKAVILRAVAAVSLVWNDLEEVAAHLPRWRVFALRRESGNRLDLLGKDGLLHFAGGGHFAFEQCLLAAGAVRTKQDTLQPSTCQATIAT